MQAQAVQQISHQMPGANVILKMNEMPTLGEIKNVIP